MKKLIKIVVAIFIVSLAFLTLVSNAVRSYKIVHNDDSLEGTIGFN